MSQLVNKFLIERCHASLLNCAKNVAEDLDAPNYAAQVESLTNIAKKHCVLDYERTVRDEMLPKWLKDNADVDLADLERKKEELRKAISKEAAKRAKKGDHPLLNKINMIFEKTPLPGTSRSTLDDTEEDSELVETACAIENIDPITKKPIEKRVKNKICGHVYDENSIKSYIKANRRMRCRCPVMGCGNRKHLTIKGLIED